MALSFFLRLDDGDGEAEEGSGGDAGGEGDDVRDGGGVRDEVTGTDKAGIGDDEDVRAG